MSGIATEEFIDGLHEHLFKVFTILKELKADDNAK